MFRLLVVIVVQPWLAAQESVVAAEVEGRTVAGQEVVGAEEVRAPCPTAVEWIASLLSFYLRTWRALRLINIRVRRVNRNVEIILAVALISLIRLKFVLILISRGWFPVFGLVLGAFFGPFPFHPSVLKPDFYLFRKINNILALFVN